MGNRLDTPEQRRVFLRWFVGVGSIFLLWGVGAPFVFKALGYQVNIRRCFGDKIPCGYDIPLFKHLWQESMR